MDFAAAYIRVSTEEQTTYSPAAQLEEIKEFARKNEYCIPEEWIFIDEGISGRKAENRPAFQRMIRLARQKNSRLQVILVHKYDRFARSGAALIWAEVNPIRSVRTRTRISLSRGTGRA